MEKCVSLVLVFSPAPFFFDNRQMKNLHSLQEYGIIKYTNIANCVTTVPALSTIVTSLQFVALFSQNVPVC